MNKLVSTNIRLPVEDLKILRIKAIESRKSMSQLIRELIESYLGKKTKNGSLANIIGICELNTPMVHDAAIEHDKYIYGIKRKK